MANALTGDFDAVLQVSAGTLRRLVANMHQNASGNPANPSIPHVAYLRLDDEVTGHRGSIAAQIGAPHLHLIDGATDRIHLEVGIRARYRADPDSLPLADIIHGTVRAEYRLHDIDPQCVGWHRAGGDYFWFRVVKDSVTFEGTVLNESLSLVFSHLLNEPVIKTHLTKHLASILARQFEPAPQRVDKRFQRIRSIRRGDGPADAAIAIPYGLTTETPPGDLASIGDLFLRGHDFGLAVSADFIMSKVRPLVTPLVGWQADLHHEIDAGAGGGLSIDYHARVDTAGADWLGAASVPFMPVSGGLIHVRLTGVGWASRLYRSGVFMLESISASDLRINFTIDQLIRLTFDSATEFLQVSASGPPMVNVTGGPKAGYVIAVAKSEIQKRARSRLAGPLAEAQSQLSAIGASQSRGDLVKALKGLDTGADAHFVDAIFRPDGVVLCGPVPLTHRHRPQVSFEQTPARDGFDAIESWIPGGRIDRFEWTWRWFTSPIETSPGPPGTATEEDTFMLRRPQQPRSKFGLSIALEKPLPGLDGNGKVCLALSGVHVDPFSGALVPVRSVIDCQQFGFELKLPYEVGPLVRLWDPMRKPGRRTPEIGIMRLGVPEARATSNTLVLYLDERWDDEAIETLTRGLEACRSQGTGLLVVLLFREGAFAGGDPDVQARVRELRARLPAPMLATEDVRGGWSSTLALPAQGRSPAWRLLNPSGVVSWAHDGRADAELLAATLDRRLVASAPPALATIHTEIRLGERLPIELARPECPPLPLGRTGVADAQVVFVYKGSDSARQVLEDLRRTYDRRDDDERPLVAVVVEGADGREVDALRDELQLNVPFFPDPRGVLTRRAGVRLSPTTLTVDGSGIVTGFEMGVGDRDRETNSAAERE